MIDWNVAGVVNRLRETDETERIEAKTGLGAAALKTVSSFSNEVDLRGGWIVFGLRRLDAGGYEIVGVPQPDRLQTDLDRRPVPGAQRSDLDDDAIATYRRQLGATRPDSELRDPDDDILLEAIGAVNALMHRDYETHAAVQVRRYADRVEIENPGYSLVDSQDWGRPRSQARNPTLAAAFHDLGLAEARGTGIDRMRTRMRATGLSAPELESDRVGNAFRLTLRFHHLLDEADWTWLGRFDGLDDTDRQVMILALRSQGVRNEDVRAVCSDDVLAASARLGRLRDRGLLRREGAAKQNAWYVVPAAHLPDPAQPVDLDRKPVDLGAQPDDLADKPADLAPAVGAVPKALRARLTALPKKARRDQVEALLCDICALRWWEPGELARLLGRNRSYLIQTFLTPLVAQGRLRLRYPDSKHHPRQAYGGVELGGEE